MDETHKAILGTSALMIVAGIVTVLMYFSLQRIPRHVAIKASIDALYWLLATALFVIGALIVNKYARKTKKEG